jgi:hypothetical protein
METIMSLSSAARRYVQEYEKQICNSVLGCNIAEGFGQ